MNELLDDFMSVVVTVAGRMYGIRGREALTRPLTTTLERIGGWADRNRDLQCLPGDGGDHRRGGAHAAADPTSRVGRRLRFAATAVSAKLQRLRGNREQVAVRRDHYSRLVDSLPEATLDRATLTAKQMVLDLEHERIRTRIRRLNHALAWATARWAVDQAQALGATAIFVEDLATLQARGRRHGNARLSGQVRGSVMDAIRHLAAKAGIATVTVPARGTSRFCPRCGKALRHAPAPDPFVGELRSAHRTATPHPASLNRL
jgi:hypothetical protein